MQHSTMPNPSLNPRPLPTHCYSLTGLHHLFSITSSLDRTPLSPGYDWVFLLKKYIIYARLIAVLYSTHCTVTVAAEC